MQRRGLTLLLGFLVAVVVAGGGGVRGPWAPASPGQPTTADAQKVNALAPRTAGGMRME